MAKHLFVDTNVYLHYTPLEDLDLFDILDTHEIVIVIPRITIRELDEQKAQNGKRSIRERARQVLARIEVWDEGGGEIRSGVRVILYSVTPASGLFGQYNLDPSWNDDCLLAALLQYKVDNPEAAVCLLSQDSGPRISAKHLGIEAFHLDEAHKLPSILDPVERENEDLRRTILKLQNALPNLIVRFNNEGQTDFMKFKIYPPPSFEEEAARLALSEVKLKYPFKEPPDSGPKLTEKGTLLGTFAQLSAAQRGLPIPVEEYSRYNREVEKYLSEYQDFLLKLAAFRAAVVRRITFQIVIINKGAAPAEDVDVHFHFPDGFLLHTMKDAPSGPLAPREPSPPMSAEQSLVESIRKVGTYPAFHGSALVKPLFDTKGSFRMKKKNSYNITDNFDRIKQGFQAFLPKLLLTFDSFESASSFSCSYHIQPGNLPEPVIGNLHFVIEKVGPGSAE